MDYLKSEGICRGCLGFDLARLDHAGMRAETVEGSMGIEDKTALIGQLMCLVSSN